MTNSITHHHPHASIIRAWAELNTDQTARTADIVRDKIAALLNANPNHPLGFFIYCNAPIAQVTPSHVMTYHDYLSARALAPATIYARISKISSFYNYLMQDQRFASVINSNPVDLARPKAPQAYGTERSNALTDDQARDLLQHVASLALGDNLSAKRDYALLRFYFATGKRRSEIIGLSGSDIQFKDDYLIIHTKEKGSLYRASEVRDNGVRQALITYLKASERWDTKTNKPTLDPTAPIWLRHDRASNGKDAVTSHGFVHMLKRYAKEAGIGEMHLHQTRHTVARMVGEQSGDLTEVQTVLGHQSLQTTRVYLDRVAIKRDKHSANISARLGID